MKIIIEVANTHEGSTEYLYEHIKELNLINVENIKFQYLVPREFGDKDSENYKEFSRLEIKKEIFEDILILYPDINFYFDVFGNLSLKEVVGLQKKYKNILGVKLHATSSMNFKLIGEVSNFTNELFISVSGLTAIEINKLIRYCYFKKIQDKVILTYGVQNYPTNIEDIKLNKLVELKKIYGLKICLSEHLDGDLKLSKYIVHLANVMGYDYIEKHSTLNRDRRLDDDHAALNINEIKQIMEEEKNINSLISSNLLSLSINESVYRKKVKSGLYALSDIKKGEVISEDMIQIKRIEEDIEYFLNIDDLINIDRRSNMNISKGQIIKPTMIEQNILGIILVRNGSSRLEEKALRHIGEIPSIDFLIKRLKKSNLITKFVLCTTSAKQDDILEKYAIANDIECIRGSENICERLNLLFSQYSCDSFLRLTGDNVFVDPLHIDEIIPEFIDGTYDYYKHEKVIDGCDFEIIRKDAYDTLEIFFENYKDNSEYMTLFLKNDYFKIMNPKKYNFNIDYLKYRFTLDYYEDLENINKAYSVLQNIFFSYEDLCKEIVNKNFDYLEFNPINKAIGIKPKRKI